MAKDEEMIELSELLYSALKIAGKYAREYLPAEMPNDVEYIRAMIDGSKDPEGDNFVSVWIMKAMREKEKS
jgi:hypothetical protein